VQQERFDEATKDRQFGMNTEHVTIAAELDSVNISEEMARTGMWRSIVSNESSSSLIKDYGSGEERSSSKRRSG
jgi:hypothetical protein